MNLGSVETLHGSKKRGIGLLKFVFFARFDPKFSWVIILALSIDYSLSSSS